MPGGVAQSNRAASVAASAVEIVASRTSSLRSARLRPATGPAKPAPSLLVSLRRAYGSCPELMRSVRPEARPYADVRAAALFERDVPEDALLRVAGALGDPLGRGVPRVDPQLDAL